MGGNVIFTARYVRAPLPEHAGNPLIEALPPYAEAEKIMKTFGIFPAIDDTDRKLPRAMRMLAVSRLNYYLEPLPRHFEIVEKIGGIIRSGYQYRNPTNPEYLKEVKEKRYQQAMDGYVTPIEESTPATAPAFALFGVSGVGKTTAVERALTYIPQVIRHPEHNILQLAYIKLECPYRGNLANFLRNFLEKASLLLDTELATTGNIGDLLVRVKNLAEDHFLGLILIDEIQNLLDARGTGDAELINFFVLLTNMIKVPVCVIGTPRAIGFFNSKFREARRVADFGCLIWDRATNGDEWDYFINQLWKYQWTSKKVPLEKNLLKVMYRYTQGVNALAVRLFQLSQLHAIRIGEDQLTEDIITTVYNEKFILVHDAIRALAKPLRKNIASYEDLLDKGLKELQAEVDTEARLEDLKGQDRNDNQKAVHKLRATSCLINMGIDSSDAERLAENIFATDDNMTAVKAVRIILEKLDTTEVYPPREILQVLKSEPEQSETPAESLRKKRILRSS
jgi:hypothetical protein